MPIRPENKARYPKNWPEIRQRIGERSGWRCECTGECGRTHCHLGEDGRCINRQGESAWLTGSRVVLTVAHLDHVPEHCDDSNLRHMCQGCHLHYDKDHHAETARATRRKNLRVPDMFEDAA